LKGAVVRDLKGFIARDFKAAATRVNPFSDETKVILFFEP
jgi:hypothetical protein